MRARIYICGEREPSRDSSGVNRIVVAELDFPFEKLRHEPSLFPILDTNSRSSVLMIRRDGFVFLISHGGDALRAASLLDVFWFLCRQQRSLYFVHVMFESMWPQRSLNQFYSHAPSLDVGVLWQKSWEVCLYRPLNFCIFDRGVAQFTLNHTTLEESYLIPGDLDIRVFPETTPNCAETSRRPPEVR